MTEIAIYSEFHDIFRGDKAAYRKPKTILRTFEDNKDLKTRLNHFCSSSGIPQSLVIDTIRHLLEEEVFASQIKAKLRFPHLFQLSAGSLRKKEKWESEAAMSEAGAIVQSLQGNKIDGFDPPESEEPKEILVKRKKSVEKKPQISLFAPPPSEVSHPDPFEGGTTSLSPTATAHTPAVTQKEPDTGPNVEEAIDTIESKLPNLFPVYLPYPVQHKLTTEAQRILEHICYDFVKKWLPEKTATEQFANPENAELPMWARLIKKKLKELAANSYNKSALGPDSIAKVVGVIENLRHTAVHRLKTHSKGLEDMLSKAVIFAVFLKDERAEKLRRLLNKAMELSSALENEKILLHNKLKQELEEIEEARQVLRQKEELALKRILEDDRITREAISFDLADLEIELGEENEMHGVDLNLVKSTDSNDIQPEFTELVSEVNDDKSSTLLNAELDRSEYDSCIDYDDQVIDAPSEKQQSGGAVLPTRYTIEALLGINPGNGPKSKRIITASNETPKSKLVSFPELTEAGNLLTPGIDVVPDEPISLGTDTSSGYYIDSQDV
ncbi:hypothetical protein ABW21_db0209372 [Orbilia brochopaga]|nr:hypothetical protein ABW21_db0209372 [Drechslerella brochopaga]